MLEPLAVRMRPKMINDIVGQTHLVGKDKILYNLIKNKRLVSMIFYGDPGTGKTSMANVLINELALKSRTLNAVINNKKDFDIVVEEAKMHNGLVLIMDEIHRLNKDKQDLLLPYIESGLITLIGITTANPFYSIRPAIRSRCQLFEFLPLTDNEIINGLKKIIKKELIDIQIDKKALEYIASSANGDLRYALNLLEVSYLTSKDHLVDLELLKSISNKPILMTDSNEDGHYDLLSALQKSIRGSDVNASLYYLGRLLFIGDLESIFRRLSVIAYEDIGLANTSIGPKLYAAIEAANRIGMPEARIPLGEIVIEMSLSPKSNSAIVAIDKVLTDIELGKNYRIPENIRINTTTYKYPHDFPTSFVKQTYLPVELKNTKYYVPRNNQSEKILKEILEKLDTLNK